MRKKSLYLLIIFAFVHYFSVYQLNAQTSNLGTTVAANSGNQIVIPLNLSNFTNIGSMDIRILFDNSKLSFVGIENLSADASGTLANAIVLTGTNSRLNISWLAQGSSGVNFANGKFFDIRFNYSGGNTSLNFDPLTCEVADWNGDIINVNYTNVSIIQSITLQSFNVSGGGNYCQNSNGVSVTLSGSQIGLNYQLKKNASDFGNLVSGTGNALVWNNLLSGTYTVEAQYNSTTLLMNGNAIASELSNLTVNASISASQNPAISGTNVSFIATAINGGSNPSFQWYVNNIAVGNNSNQYLYNPLNNDVVKCVVNSNESCAINNPATSNLITMIVNQPQLASVNLGDTIFAENNTNINIPLNFSNLLNIGAMDIKIEFDTTVLSFINLDSLTTEANGVLYNVTSTNSKYKVLNISWLAQGTSGVNMPNSRFFIMKFLYKGGETNLLFKTNLCEIADWNGDLININYKNGYVESRFRTLNLKLYLQGLCRTNDGSPFTGIMAAAQDDVIGDHFNDPNIADEINVDIYDNLLNVVISTTVLLNTNGTVSIPVSPAYNESYYIAIRHRNSLETWSALPVSFNSKSITYDFSTAANKAYRTDLTTPATMKEVIPGVFAILVGDVNQDLVIDGFDLFDMDADITNGASGYLSNDVNGDGVVDGFDLQVMDENVTNGSYLQRP